MPDRIWFNVEQGYRFAREDGGAVTMEDTYAGRSKTFQPEEWASITAAVSKGGAGQEAEKQARAFHLDPEPVKAEEAPAAEGGAATETSEEGGAEE